MDGNKLGLDLLYEVIVMIVMMFNHVTILGQMANLFSLSNYSYLKEKKLTVPAEGILLEKAMTTHSSTLAWKIPWMEDPGRLQSIES